MVTFVEVGYCLASCNKFWYPRLILIISGRVFFFFNFLYLGSCYIYGDWFVLCFYLYFVFCAVLCCSFPAWCCDGGCAFLTMLSAFNITDAHNIRVLMIRKYVYMKFSAPQIEFSMPLVMVFLEYVYFWNHKRDISHEITLKLLKPHLTIKLAIMLH